MPALCDIKINCLKCEGDHITMIFDRLNGYSDIKKNGYSNFLVCLCWKCQETKTKETQWATPPVPFKKKETEKVFHYKYDTGDYMIHNKLIPM